MGIEWGNEPEPQAAKNWPQPKPRTWIIMTESDRLPINEAQLVLAEKRTWLATLRTGIAVLVLPLSVVSFLIAFTEHFKDLSHVGLLIPLLVVCAGLAVLGGYLVLRSVMHLRRAEKELQHLKKNTPALGEFLD